jgi:hypothetical protein
MPGRRGHCLCAPCAVVGDDFSGSTGETAGSAVLTLVVALAGEDGGRGGETPTDSGRDKESVEGGGLHWN